MKPYKVETCHVALVLSLTPVAKHCDNLFVKAQNDFFYHIFFFQVEIAINEEEVDIQMKLGQAGEAFFVEKVKERREVVPYNLATSPIPSAAFLSNEQFTFRTEVLQLLIIFCSFWPDL